MSHKQFHHSSLAFLMKTGILIDSKTEQYYCLDAPLSLASKNISSIEVIIIMVMVFIVIVVAIFCYCY